MFKFFILCVIGVFLYLANTKYESTGLWTYRRKRVAYSWAFLGAATGSFFGIAGMGTAIAGTIPGAFIAYLIASNMMKADVNPGNETHLLSVDVSKPALDARSQFAIPDEDECFDAPATNQTFEIWLMEFKRGAGEVNDSLAISHSSSLIDLMDLTPLRRSYLNEADPYGLGAEFGEQFIFPDFIYNFISAADYSDNNGDPSAELPYNLAALL